MSEALRKAKRERELEKIRGKKRQRKEVPAEKLADLPVSEGLLYELQDSTQAHLKKLRRLLAAGKDSSQSALGFLTKLQSERERLSADVRPGRNKRLRKLKDLERRVTRVMNEQRGQRVAGKPYTRDEMIAAMGGIDAETGSLDRIDAMTLTEALAGVARGEHWSPEDDPEWAEPYEFGADKTTTWITSGEAAFSWADLREWVKREGASTGWAKENLR